MKDITKHYHNGDLTIVWKPGVCIHAGECVKALPQVYKPKEKPWITPENATIDELKAQIAKCPSGALSYVMKSDEESTAEAPAAEVTNIQVTENGPLLCQGTVDVTMADGTVVREEKMTAFCRCGASSNKPYCDGAHNKVGFQG